MTRAVPVAMTIAGSDCSGGAGIQADLKTFSAFAVYGASAITALTAQNTLGVHGVHAVPAPFVVSQMEAVLCDLKVGAIKTGMLATSAIVEAVAKRLAPCRQIPLVADPVMIATSGDSLIAADAVAAIRRHLLPLATLITPNLPEAAVLLGIAPATNEHEQGRQAQALLALGCGAVLLKGGHGEGDHAVDLLATRHGLARFSRARIATRSTHGTGCTLSAAIAALLATGVELEQAVERAKSFVWEALRSGQELGLGAGHGPIDPLFAIRRLRPPS